MSGSLDCEVAIVGMAPSRHDGASGSLRIGAGDGQHVFDAGRGWLRYEQDGGRTWTVRWRRLVLAEPPPARADLLRALGVEVPDGTELGNETRCELARLCGCAIEWRPEHGGWVPAHDASLQTTVAGVEIAGAHVLGSPLPDSAWPFLEGLAAICPCEGVTLADVERTVADLGCSLRAVKVHTRAGSGAGCQGAFCRTPIQSWMHRRFGYRPELEPPPAQRAPLVPVTIRAWLDREEARS
jgi:hypothetical protein